VEREVIFTGIGGQGVQFAAEVLAQAMMFTGKQVALLGLYTGEMRGGLSEATVIVADGRIEAPMIVAHPWSAVVLHPQYWEQAVARVRPGGLVVANSNTATEQSKAWAEARGTIDLLEIPATDIALAHGGEHLIAMVMAGAYARAASDLGPEALRPGLSAAIPPHRRERFEENLGALEAGYETADASRLSVRA
jgi:2-oxoglutarate ferredoxin oxidoreductase subunit gamma